MEGFRAVNAQCLQKTLHISRIKKNTLDVDSSDRKNFFWSSFCLNCVYPKVFFNSENVRSHLQTLCVYSSERIDGHVCDFFFRLKYFHLILISIFSNTFYIYLRYPYFTSDGSSIKRKIHKPNYPMVNCFRWVWILVFQMFEFSVFSFFFLVESFVATWNSLIRLYNTQKTLQIKYIYKIYLPCVYVWLRVFPYHPSYFTLCCKRIPIPANTVTFTQFSFNFILLTVFFFYSIPKNTTDPIAEII